MNKPATPEAALAHYGVKGMKWGVRKARTGQLGRGAASLERYAAGKPRVFDRVTANISYTPKDAAAGLSKREAAKHRAAALRAERKRLATGKETAADILNAYGTVTLAEIALSLRDSKKSRDNNSPA